MNTFKLTPEKKQSSTSLKEQTKLTQRNTFNKPTPQLGSVFTANASSQVSKQHCTKVLQLLSNNRKKKKTISKQNKKKKGNNLRSLQ